MPRGGDSRSVSAGVVEQARNRRSGLSSQRRTARRHLGIATALGGAGVLLAVYLCAGVSAFAAGTPVRVASAFNCHKPGAGARAPKGGHGEERVLPGGAEYERVIPSRHETRFYICSFAGGTPDWLGWEVAKGEYSEKDLIFAGDWAAVVVGESLSSGDARIYLEVIDLAKHGAGYGKVLLEQENEDQGVEYHNVGRLVLKRDGAAAWTEQQKSGAYYVIEHTHVGTRTLDETNTTRPYSLKLKGSTLSWLEHNGEARGATLH